MLLFMYLYDTQEVGMAKKQAQFRFEENFLVDINKFAQKEGMTVSEIVRNALKFYIALYERTKGKNVRLYLESDKQKENKCELIVPWIH